MDIPPVLARFLDQFFNAGVEVEKEQREQEAEYQNEGEPLALEYRYLGFLFHVLRA